MRTFFISLLTPLVTVCLLSASFTQAGRRSWIQKQRQQRAEDKNIMIAMADRQEPLWSDADDELLDDDITQPALSFEQSDMNQDHAARPEVVTNAHSNDDQSAAKDQNISTEPEIELYFENASLTNFVQQIEDVFDVTFIMDDALDPLPKDAQALKGNKLSYRTREPITRKQAWSVFNTFLNVAGFALVPHVNERTYRIMPIKRAQKSHIPTYIGVTPESLPDSDELIRYVYFLENASLETIGNVVKQFVSTSSGDPILLQEHKGIILTDIAYNIKKLMEIIKELDKITMPESLSVLKLRRADAVQVKELYDSLTQKEQEPRFGPRPGNQAQALALPENVTIIAEPRTNSLILLGPQQARDRIEQFIVKNIDVELDQAYSPLHTYQLRYASAQTIAEIMNNVTRFGANTEAGKSGGVRGGDKYLRPMSFIAEPSANKLIIKGHYEDYLKAEKIIQTLDEDQPQVAIEVLLLSVNIDKKKELGAQIRSKVSEANNGGGWDGLLGKNIKFQTSGLFKGSAQSGIVQKTTDTPGVKRLLGNLMNLVTGASVGNTIVTLGEDLCNVWGILQMLETVTNVQLVSNPFLIATNKTPAEVSLGETRRVKTADIVGGGEGDDLAAFGNEKADLIVKVTPQISSDGMIVLDLDITIDDFTDQASATSPTKNTRNIKTSTIVANKQVIALGGLVRNRISNEMSKTPVLGDVPILGWFFKNKRKTENKQNLLVLISTTIIEPTNQKELGAYNTQRITEYEGSLKSLQSTSDKRDPIHRMFFDAGQDSTEKAVESFLFDRKKGRGRRASRVRKRREEKESKQKELLVRKQVEQAPTPTLTAYKTTQTHRMPTQKTAHDQRNARTSSQPLKTVAHTTKTQGSALQHALKKKKRTNLALSSFLPNTGETA